MCIQLQWGLLSLSCVYNYLRIVIVADSIQPVDITEFVFMSSRKYNVVIVVWFEVLFLEIERHGCASGATMAGLVIPNVSANENEISRIQANC